MESNYRSILDTFSELETRNLSEEYMKKYWIAEAEWLTYWQPIKNDIFCSTSTHLPEMMFENDFELIALIGGVIFTEQDFYLLQDCMKETGDKLFAIIENEGAQPIITDENGKRVFHPPLRFKFPIDIGWQELKNGGGISMEIFESTNREFFVYGDSVKWGKYVANEYWERSIDPAGTPLEIIGFKKEFSDLFNKKFKFNLSRSERRRIMKWLPKLYKNRISQI